MKKILFIFLPLFSFSQIPNYYNSIDFSQEGDVLKNQLSTLIINTHSTLVPYTSSTLDTWDVLKESDISTEDNVLLVYGYNDTDDVSKNDRERLESLSCHSSSCIGLWNREHVYPKSRATPSLQTDHPSAGTDVHNLKPCDSQMNSSRNNRLFVNSTGNSHIDGDGYWYPGDEWKGDVARIVMYMYLRYPNQCPAINIGTGSTSYSNFNDMYDLFLEWNIEDPVSQHEERRNNYIYSIQGNRNPFIDNPFLATMIWNGDPAEDKWQVLNTENLRFNQIKIFPTIATDYIILSNVSSTESIYVYNSNGQKINIEIVDHKINIQSIETGIYFIQIRNKILKKFIKVKN